jgi:hypothetical protein
VGVSVTGSGTVRVGRGLVGAKEVVSVRERVFVNVGVDAISGKSDDIVGSAFAQPDNSTKAKSKIKNRIYKFPLEHLF